MRDRQDAGKDLIAKLCEHILATVRDHPGKKNADIAKLSGVTVNIEAQRGYISWTILEHLVQSGRLEKKESRYYSMQR